MVMGNDGESIIDRWQGKLKAEGIVSHSPLRTRGKDSSHRAVAELQNYFPLEMMSPPSLSQLSCGRVGTLKYPHVPSG